jgi:nucleoside-diphosphate-sugar epimerase
MRVLLTGAAGKIGRVILAHLVDRHDWILTDRRPVREARGLPFVQADLGDFDARARCCDGRSAAVREEV